MDYGDTTVVIPVKDEPATEKVTRGVLKALPGCKVIVIYKGALAMKFTHRNLRIIKQKESGKGRGMVQAVKSVNTGIVCFVDGDDTYDARDLKKVVALVREGYDMVMGDRMSNIHNETMPLYVQFGNNVLTATENILFGLRLKDSQTGLRAMRTVCFRQLHLREPHFGIESEMNVKAKKSNFKMTEIPAKYYVRTGTAKHVKLSGGFRLFFINLGFLLER